MTQQSDRNARTLEEARARYGKAFAHEIKVRRLTPPSHHLQHIEARVREAQLAMQPGTVRALRPADTAFAQRSGAGGGAKARSPQTADFIGNVSARRRSES